jgi:valyl-tRNA synthetase
MTETDNPDQLSSTTYQHKIFETKWLEHWKKLKVFSVDKYLDRPSYTILMPPPNVTSKLHMGHGTTYTFQDLMIRRQRMLGKNAFWLPGTDHAGIATQMMVERELLETEGKRKEDLGRVEFVKRCEDWKEKYGGIIYEQFETIGFSADFDRKSYTMDPELSKAVRHAFHELYSEGLIYRGERLVNWDPVLKTAISDDEIENKEINVNCIISSTKSMAQMSV